MVKCSLLLPAQLLTTTGISESHHVFVPISNLKVTVSSESGKLKRIGAKKVKSLIEKRGTFRDKSRLQKTNKQKVEKNDKGPLFKSNGVLPVSSVFLMPVVNLVEYYGFRHFTFNVIAELMHYLFHPVDPPFF